MKILLKVIAWLLTSIIVLVVGVFTAARFNDGPVAAIAGGPFTTGNLHRGMSRIGPSSTTWPRCSFNP